MKEAEVGIRRIRTLTVVAVVAVALMGAVAAFAELPPGGSFSDDNGNVHEANIEAIAADNITKGCNPPANSLYCPKDRVTRGQMAAFLVRALDLAGSSEDYFTDDDGTVFEANINALAAAGITQGCNPPANDQYCPNDTVTRGQMAAFLVRAFGYTDDGGGGRFSDTSGTVFESVIDRLATAGVTAGCNPPTNDQYCPDSPVLRDQMASFLARALGLDPITPPPPIDVSPICEGVTDIPALECEALADIWEATSGDGWSLGVWGFSDQACQWFGVECNSDDTHVIRLRLNQNGLVGTLPASMGDLTELEQIIMQANTLSGSLPASIGNLGSLTFISLGNNELAGEIPASWHSGLNDTLTTLSLWGNGCFTLPDPAPAGMESWLDGLNSGWDDGC